MLLFFDLIDSEEQQEKFILLYEKYINLVNYIALQEPNRNYSLAEECVQETFFYIAKNFNKFNDVESKSTKELICIIAQAFSIKSFCSENQFENISIGEYAEQNVKLPYGFDNFEILDLKLDIDKLSDDYKNLIYLKYLFGIKSREIAEIYSISDSAVRKRLQFARKKIRNSLEMSK